MILEELVLHDINQDLQTTNNEEINPARSTDGHPVAQTFVKDIENSTEVQMRGIKSYFDKRNVIEEIAKQIEEMKSGFESALNKETEQYRTPCPSSPVRQTLGIPRSISLLKLSPLPQIMSPRPTNK